MENSTETYKADTQLTLRPGETVTLENRKPQITDSFAVMATRVPPLPHPAMARTCDGEEVMTAAIVGASCVSGEWVWFGLSQALKDLVEDTLLDNPDFKFGEWYPLEFYRDLKATSED